MNLRLRVSKVLVTGGGSGIGLAIAKALINEGCHVCITGRDLEKLKKAKAEVNSDRLSVMQWDVCDISLIREKINEAAALCGGYLDGLVNNAGVYVSSAGWNPWFETDEIWDKVWDTNLKAQIFLLRRFTNYLNHQVHMKGNICCISSMCSNSYEVRGSYEASKYALSRMVRSHAKQVIHLGIVINGINPGVVYSPMSPYETNSSQAIKRPIKAEEIADCAMFLMSEKAVICCGEMLNADGGALYAI